MSLLLSGHSGKNTWPPGTAVLSPASDANMRLTGVVGFSVFLSAIAFAQSVPSSLPDLKTSLSVEKTQYFLGEPIMLTFAAQYTGNKGGMDLYESDPYGKCGNYHITVSPSAPKAQPITDSSCVPYQIEEIECLSGGFHIPAGTETKEFVLLNRFHDFSRPGTYTVKVMRELGDAKYLFHPENSNQDRRSSHAETSATFTFTVVAPQSVEDIRPSFEPFIQGLSSRYADQRIDAALVISTLAAPFLERYLLQMLSTAGLEDTGVEGLLRLNTEKGREAIFEFLKTANDEHASTYWAAHALIDMGDARYGQQLLHLANQCKSYRKEQVLLAGARLDPSAAMPVVREQLASADEDERRLGAEALAATETKEAIPMLVNLLNDPSSSVGWEAVFGLESLTRINYLTTGLTNTKDDPKGAIAFWSGWLKSHPDLPIRLTRECWQDAER